MVLVVPVCVKSAFGVPSGSEQVPTLDPHHPDQKRTQLSRSRREVWRQRPASCSAQTPGQSPPDGRRNSSRGVTCCCGGLPREPPRGQPTTPAGNPPPSG